MIDKEITEQISKLLNNGFAFPEHLTSEERNEIEEDFGARRLPREGPWPGARQACAARRGASARKSSAGEKIAHRERAGHRPSRGRFRAPMCFLNLIIPH